MPKTLKEQAEEKFGKKDAPGLKEKLNAWLDENVNQPLAKEGYEDLGAGLSAAGSAMGEFIPESGIELMATPGLRALKALRKTKKITPKAQPKFSDLETPKAQRAKAKEIAGEHKAVKGSKTREAQDKLEEELLAEDWERKARLGENPTSPVLDYSKFK